MTPSPEPSRCPLCGCENRCAMAQAQASGTAPGPCWCVAQHFPAALLARVPAEARDKACICAACVARFHAEHPEVAG